MRVGRRKKKKTIGKRKKKEKSLVKFVAAYRAIHVMSSYFWVTVSSIAARTTDGLDSPSSKTGQHVQDVLATVRLR